MKHNTTEVLLGIQKAAAILKQTAQELNENAKQLEDFDSDDLRIEQWRRMSIELEFASKSVNTILT